MSFANGTSTSKSKSYYSYKRQWYEENRDRSLALMKKYNDEHKDAIKEKRRIHHLRTYLQKGRHGVCNNRYIVRQYDAHTGELIDTYSSIYAAAIDNGINEKTIRNAVDKNGGLSPRLGWRWEVFRPSDLIK